MYPICEAIKRKRKQLKETQEEFAKRFGISHAAISDMERGVTTHIPITILDFVLDINNLPDLSQLGIPPKKEFLIRVKVVEEANK